MEDRSLLETYRQSRSEDAFREIVRRHAGMVHAACKRRLRGKRHLAEDAAQAVFVLLATKPEKVGQPERLAGWLYHTTSFVTSHLLEEHRRRQRREREAAAMAVRGQGAEDTDARSLENLDAALDRLPARFRDVIVLHHLQGWTVAETASELRCGERTVRRRLLVGLEKLRTRLAGRGANVSGALLVSWLSSRTATAPAGLASACEAAALSSAASAGMPMFSAGGMPLTSANAAAVAGAKAAATQSIAKGAAKMMFLAKAKLCAGIAAVAMVTSGSGIGIVQYARAAEPVRQVEPDVSGKRSVALGEKTAPKGDKRGKAEATKPLRFSVTAESRELKWKPSSPGKASEVQPTRLTFTFTNTSKKPIKLDAYDLFWRRVKIAVRGPAEGSVVRVTRVVERKIRHPEQSDYPVIAPGGRWSSPYRLRFPGSFSTTIYRLTAPGPYRLTITYANSKPSPKVKLPDFALGTWVGELKAEELVLTVPEKDGKGAAVDGKAALEAVKMAAARKWRHSRSIKSVKVSPIDEAVLTGAFPGVMFFDVRVRWFNLGIEGTGRYCAAYRDRRVVWAFEGRPAKPGNPPLSEVAAFCKDLKAATAAEALGLGKLMMALARYRTLNAASEAPKGLSPKLAANITKPKVSELKDEVSGEDIYRLTIYAVTDEDIGTVSRISIDIIRGKGVQRNFHGVRQKKLTSARRRL